MDALVIVIVALLALAAGGALGFLLGRSSGSSGMGDSVQTATLTAERDRALSDAAGLRENLSVEQQQRAGLEARLQAEQIASEQRLADLQQAQARLSEQFAVLSAEALKANNEQFLQVAEQRLKASQTVQAAELAKREKAVETMVEPIQKSLDKVELHLHEVEKHRTTAYSELRTQVEGIGKAHELLTNETQGLRTALRKPQVRGAWGELQLQRCLELGGMLEHCDFVTQESTDTQGGLQRPDVVVKLVGGKSLVIDSKVPLEAYLDATSTDDPIVREERMAAHARNVRTHIDQLASKAYWRALAATPEFVILFIPGESMLADALSAEPSLIVHASDKGVMLSSPVSLILMLKTANYAWREDALAKDARKVFEEGRELYKRLGTLGDHLDKVGKGLASTVKAYNGSIASFERTVLPSARRMNELKVSDTPPVEPRVVDEPLSSISAPELVESIEAAERPVYLVTEDIDALPTSGAQVGEPLPGDEVAGG